MLFFTVFYINNIQAVKRVLEVTIFVLFNIKNMCGFVARLWLAMDGTVSKVSIKC